MIKRTAVLGTLLLATGCARPTLPSVPALTLPNEIRIGTNTGVALVPFEEYVLATALAEVGPAGESDETAARVFEVQSIIARSYAAAHIGRHMREGFDLCDTTHCQVYNPNLPRTSRFANVAQMSVTRTRASVLVFSGRIAETLFHADCGGHTADASAVWGGAGLPYLVGAPDDVPSETHLNWQLVVPSARLVDALHLDARSDPGTRLDLVTVDSRDTSGRATRLRLDGERIVELRGEDFRAIVNRTFGARAIRSTLFSVDRDGQSYRFTGTGYGHGVGLCQVGATARARRGEPVDKILGVYYPGARIFKARG